MKRVNVFTRNNTRSGMNIYIQCHRLKNSIKKIQMENDELKYRIETCNNLSARYYDELITAGMQIEDLNDQLQKHILTLENKNQELIDTHSQYNKEKKDLEGKTLMLKEILALKQNYFCAVYERISTSNFKRILDNEEKLIQKSCLFDDGYYIKKYSDVKEAQFDPLHHFVVYGWLEFRNPNKYFDTFYYLKNNVDVARRGLNALVHFINSGYKEGRNPCPAFNIKYYLECNDDIKCSGINPLEHYLKFGENEGRKICP